MSKQVSIEQKLRRMKRGESFYIADEKERENVYRAAKTLFKAGVIDFQVITRRDGEQFKVVAI